MDQIKIGEFIANERKQKKLTQQQLADILGISKQMPLVCLPDFY